MTPDKIDFPSCFEWVTEAINTWSKSYDVQYDDEGLERRWTFKNETLIIRFVKR